MFALSDYAIYAPSTQALQGKIQDPSQGPVGLYGGGLAEALEAFIRHAKTDEACGNALDEALEILDWVDAVATTKDASAYISPSVTRTSKVVLFEDLYMRKDRHTVSAYDASEGALYVLYLLLTAMAPGMPALFAIDNFDQALNPRLAQALARLYCGWILGSGDRQVLFTTHNASVLDGLPLDDDRVRLFSVDRNNKGHTVVSRVTLTDDIRKRARDKDWPLSRQWLMGHIGGVPHG